MKRPFLVCHDYGMGGLWAFMLAESEDDITGRFPSLVVVTERPSWMDETEEENLRRTMTVDIDDEDHPFTKAIQSGHASPSAKPHPTACKLCRGSGRNPGRFSKGIDGCPRCGGSGEEPEEPDRHARIDRPNQKRR
jgi:hypothetical protein